MKILKFTFIEVLIASLILAFSAVAVVEMTTRAHLQTYDVEKEWKKEHLLAVSCEYFLLFGHEATIPEELLPDSYSASCEIQPYTIPEDVDPEKYDPINGWALGELTIRLFYEGEEINSIMIKKILPDEALQ